MHHTNVKMLIKGTMVCRLEVDKLNYTLSAHLLCKSKTALKIKSINENTSKITLKEYTCFTTNF